MPNIVVLLGDDLGSGDPGCYNPDSKVPTPNMDRLAREGLRFTNAYCPDAICTPSRYSLMTGRYSWRTSQTAAVQFNWEPPLIEAGRLTLASVLQRVGYHTGGFGKWHLGAEFPTLDGKAPLGQYKQRDPQDGANLDLSAPLRGGPCDRGFNQWYGFICASESLVYDGRHAVDTIDVYPHPHANGVRDLRHLVLEDYLPEVNRRSVDFLERQAPTARQGRPFFLYYSPYVPHVPLAVPKAFKGKTRAGDYGDYVAALDDGIGQILDTLDRIGGETLVIFASDNGSQYVTTGEGHRPNGSLNGRKGTIFEGGVRSPMIVRWPGKIVAGSVTHQLAALTDWVATLAELTGQALPDNVAEDSFSLLPVLTGTRAAGPVRQDLVVKAGGAHLALRSGPWKYISEPGFAIKGPPLPPDTPKLFNLEADPCEATDRTAENDAVARELRARLAALAGTPSSRTLREPR